MAAFPGRPNPWLTLIKLLAALIAAGVLVAGVALPYVGGLGLVAGHEADKFLDKQCHLQQSPPPQKTDVYASDGKTLIATLFTQDRQPISLSKMPKYLQDALVATEDRRFYQHHGVDLRGLIRSAVSTSNGDTQGGSTLTMQYVKQIRYFEAIENGNRKAARAAINQNINRKIEDAKCALYIEGTLHESKHKILQNYLNISFFGENAYGIQSAAETYFGVPASRLTLDQSAMLVGLLQEPSATTRSMTALLRPRDATRYFRTSSRSASCHSSAPIASGRNRSPSHPPSPRRSSRAAPTPAPRSRMPRSSASTPSTGCRTCRDSRSPRSTAAA